MVYPSFIMLLMSWHQHLFGTSKKLKLSFPATTCILFGRAFQPKNTSMFHFHSVQPFPKGCLHVAVCTNSKSSDCALMFKFLHSSSTQIQCPPPPLTICSECTIMPCFRKFSPRGRAIMRLSRTLSATTSHTISTSKNKDTSLHIDWSMYALVRC